MDRQLFLLKRFHQAFNHPISLTPTDLHDNLPLAGLRANLIQEELDEYCEACTEHDIVMLWVISLLLFSALFWLMVYKIIWWMYSMIL
jgi:hypothetical protein